MKIKDKLLIIISIIIVLLFISTNVFASSEISLGGITFILPDWYYEKEYRFACHYVNDSGSYCTFIYASDTPFVFRNYQNLHYYVTNTDNSEFIFTSSLAETLKTDFSSSNGSIVTEWQLSQLVKLIDSCEYYSSHDIYSGENLVFQAPPQVNQTILAPIVEETETSKTLLEVKKILPMILVVLVSFLGLRKALKMLSALLHRS